MKEQLSGEYQMICNGKTMKPPKLKMATEISFHSTKNSKNFGMANNWYRNFRGKVSENTEIVILIFQKANLSFPKNLEIPGGKPNGTEILGQEW